MFRLYSNIFQNKTLASREAQVTGENELLNNENEAQAQEVSSLKEKLTQQKHSCDKLQKTVQKLQVY